MSETNTDIWTPTLPRAVREQVERANQLAREAGVANVPPPSASEGTQAPESNPVTSGVTHGAVLGDTEIPPEFQNAGTVSTVDTASSDHASSSSPDDTQVLAGEGVPSSTSSPPTHAPAHAEPVNWEARYNTLQGKYNAEIPGLRGEIQALKDTINALSMSQRPAREEIPPPTHTPRAPVYEVPASDVENYGQDLIAATQRWAEAKYAPTMADYERRLAAVEGNTRQLGQLSMTQRVEAALDGAIPNWRDLNANDPVWDDWLNQTDVFSGRPRKQLITEAYQAGDAPRTIAFFQSYLREQTAVTPPHQPGIRQNQTGSGGMPAGPASPTPLEMLAVPGRGPVSNPNSFPASSAPNGNGSRRNWSGAEISAFFDQVRRGLWRGREAEVAAIERDITLSGLEGRYTA